MALVWHPVKVRRVSVPITTHIKRLDPLGTFFLVCRRRHHQKIRLLRPGNDHLSMHHVRRPRSPVNLEVRY